jgi:hypothetical protein
MTFGENVIGFNQRLTFAGKLPEGIRVMNPFSNDRVAARLTELFYTKFFNDNLKRFLVLGINPGRFGAGATGIPFTDTKRLREACGIEFHGFQTHETSSEYIYAMIHAFGGVAEFYRKFLISAVCPLGFTTTGKSGIQVNYNYYDSAALTKAAYPFIVESLQEQIAFGIDTSVCFCLGTGKNEHFLNKLNATHHFFSKIVALEHPRYIMQYKTKSKEHYIRKYLDAFRMLH